MGILYRFKTVKTCYVKWYYSRIYNLKQLYMTCTTVLLKHFWENSILSVKSKAPSVSILASRRILSLADNKKLQQMCAV